MKRYYFSMESTLANRLGMTKDELHNNIKSHFPEFVRTSDDAGNTVYQSIEGIEDEETMMARITGFQHWAAQNFDYTFEPYKTDTDATTGTTGLLYGGKS